MFINNIMEPFFVPSRLSSNAFKLVCEPCVNTFLYICIKKIVISVFFQIIFGFLGPNLDISHSLHFSLIVFFVLLGIFSSSVFQIALSFD